MKYIKCIKCKEIKKEKEFKKLSNPKPHTNGRRKHCDKCCEGRRFREDGTMIRERKKRERKVKKAKEAVELAGSKCDAGNGFIYLYRCDELDCIKIGSTTYDPREYVSSKSREYGLKLELIAFIVSPVNMYDAERVVTHDIKHKKIKHIKPCGGVTHELFKYGISEAINKLKAISEHMYVKPNPFVDMNIVGSVEMINIISELDKIKTNKRNDIIARKILREVKKEKRWIVKRPEGSFSCICRRPVANGVHVKNGGYCIKIKGRRVYLCAISFCKREEVYDLFREVYDLRDLLFKGYYDDEDVQVIKAKVVEVRNRMLQK